MSPPPAKPMAVPGLEADINTLPVSPEAREFLLAMARDHAWNRTAREQAAALRLRNRDALRALLFSLHLPQWRILRRWFRVYFLVSSAEQGKSFARIALDEGHNPSSNYRTLEEVLRMRPGEILRRGGTALLLPELVRELDRGARFRGQSAKVLGARC